MPINIVSLGAGYDTTVFWLQEVDNGKLAEICRKNLTYVEVDFDQVVTRKTQIIQQSKDLPNYLVPSESQVMIPEDSSFINAVNYKLVANDVRKTEEMARVLVEEF